MNKKILSAIVLILLLPLVSCKVINEINNSVYWSVNDSKLSSINIKDSKNREEENKNGNEIWQEFCTALETGDKDSIKGLFSEYAIRSMEPEDFDMFIDKLAGYGEIIKKRQYFANETRDFSYLKDGQKLYSRYIHEDLKCGETYLNIYIEYCYDTPFDEFAKILSFHMKEGTKQVYTRFETEPINLPLELKIEFNK